jgi:hypothetical protein
MGSDASDLLGGKCLAGSPLKLTNDAVCFFDGGAVG